MEKERLDTIEQLERIPTYNLSGIEVNTKAFGRGKIISQEGDYLKVLVGGQEKKFVLPGCFLQGFLIPDDPSIVEAYRRAQELHRSPSEEKHSSSGKLSYHEENHDLFIGTDEYYLVHCISADFSMSKGIVTEFNRRFEIGRMLKESYPRYATAWIEEGKKFDCLMTGRVFNLVTKDRYNHRPTYDSLRGALETMREQCEKHAIKKLAMPKIASGLDRLQWDKVSGIIQNVFSDMDIEIMICIPEYDEEQRNA